MSTEERYSANRLDDGEVVEGNYYHSELQYSDEDEDKDLYAIQNPKGGLAEIDPATLKQIGGKLFDQLEANRKAYKEIEQAKIDLKHEIKELNYLYKNAFDSLNFIRRHSTCEKALGLAEIEIKRFTKLRGDK